MTILHENYLHECHTTKDGSLILIDVSRTFDCGWEGAYAVFDEKTFRNWWGDSPYTSKDIEEWGEEAEAFDGWTTVSNKHRTPEAAEKRLLKYISTL